MAVQSSADNPSGPCPYCEKQIRVCGNKETGEVPKFLRVLREQETGREWISVEDRLPEKGQPVWVRFVANPGTKAEQIRTGSYPANHSVFLTPPYVETATHWCERHIDTPPPFPTHTNTQFKSKGRRITEGE